MPKYRKRPVEVRAIQFTGDNNREVEDFVGDAAIYKARSIRGEDQAPSLHIRTLEGEMHVTKGDWVIEGIKGEFYPCKDDIFMATYEEA